MVSSDTSAHPAGGSRPARLELINSGDELLLGLATNGHLAFIGGQLARRGVMLARQVTATDDAGDLEREFRQSWDAADVVIVTGGLGPTVDDRTREAVAAVLGVRLVFDAAIEKVIAERFAAHGRSMTSNNLRQAYTLEGGEVLPNPNGTAPGLWFQRGGRIVCLLPGPPSELQPMFVDHVLPRLAAAGLVGAGEAFVQIRTAGVGESLLETRLQPILEKAGTGLSVAYCAHQGQVDVRLSSPSATIDRPGLERIAQECAEMLGNDFVCFGQDPLARVCADLLRAGEKRLAVAETATGGMLAHAFSEICGACKFFAGGVVCLSNDSVAQMLEVPECLLLQHGAVSDEVAVAMATGAAEKLAADYAVAITGFSGGAAGKGNPIGTIHVALYSPAGVWAKKLGYPGPAAAAKQRAVTVALDWLRRELRRAPAMSASQSRLSSTQ